MERFASNISLTLFIVFGVLFAFELVKTPIMQKTISGERLERIETLNSNQLPMILADYLKQNHTQFALYKIPNYIEELFKYKKDYYPIYKSMDKRTILLIVSPDDENIENKSRYYAKLRSELNLYKKDYNFINISSKRDYNIRTYRYAYEELEHACKYLCIIDPIKNTIFSLRNASDSDINALEVILQQYANFSNH